MPQLAADAVLSMVDLKDSQMRNAYAQLITVAACVSVAAFSGGWAFGRYLAIKDQDRTTVQLPKQHDTCDRITMTRAVFDAKLDKARVEAAIETNKRLMKNAMIAEHERFENTVIGYTENSSW